MSTRLPVWSMYMYGRVLAQEKRPSFFFVAVRVPSRRLIALLPNSYFLSGGMLC